MRPAAPRKGEARHISGTNHNLSTRFSVICTLPVTGNRIILYLVERQPLDIGSRW